MDAVGEIRYCRFDKDKAYTADGVLVYNVFVYNVPKKTTKAAFLKYFVKFGEVLGVHLLDGRYKAVNNQKTKNGFVNYKDPMSAAKVLKKSYHAIEKNPIYVSACESWNQPDVQTAAATAAADNEINTDDTSLLNLNDNCLDYIFKQMKMVDQVNLASSCCRLRDVFVMRARVEYKFLDLVDLKCLTLWQIWNFLQMAGPHIEHLRGHSPSYYFKRVIEVLGLYCTNVKSICIEFEPLTSNRLRKLFWNMHLVEKLDLRCVQLQDDSIPVLKKLKHLKSLSLDENYDLSGCEIKCLTSVDTLSLGWCKAINPTYFKEICESLKYLKYLNIQMCSSLLRSSMHDIVKHLHKLETIKLSCDNDPEGKIATSPSLKNLHLFGSRDCLVPPQIFKELAKFKPDQLEILAIYFRNTIDRERTIPIGELKNLKQLICPNNDKLDDNCLQNLSKLQELEFLDIQNCQGFTTMGLLSLIQKCRKLKTLNVLKCKQIDAEFATKLLQLLNSERKQHDQNEPLKVFASRSRILDFANTSSAFQEASNILLISFEFDS